MNISQYIEKVNNEYKTGNASEHSYRGYLQSVLQEILPNIHITNEPKKSKCGKPDYILTNKTIPIGYIEAKDIGDSDLKGEKKSANKEQFDRYKNGLPNIIFTDYLDFYFYQKSELKTSIKIAEIVDNKIVGLPQNYEAFTNLIINFSQTISQTIKSPNKLAEMMAGSSKLMANVINSALTEDDEKEDVSHLKSQMLSFQKLLIHDIDNSTFADIYAQTIAYGMFAARYHDPTLETFSRKEAAELIPKSNPFLRKLFQDIAGFDLDNRLVWIVDELVNIFLASDVSVIMSDFGKNTKQDDPIIHFYETFLGEYNPELKKARGVWYTPQPIVNFIVRAVDDVLKTEFDLPQGLADNSMIESTVQTDMQSKSGYKKGKHKYHRVQILDPATGTGTFLAEIIKHIHKKFKGQEGIWSSYVENDLIPRLNGFEILMASYAMAHLKMDMLLTETGYKTNTDKRFNIYLTNSLEESHPDTVSLFSSWLSNEADQANKIKRDKPVMVIMGNPPYSGESKNKNEWIMRLMEDYKKEPNTKLKLKERNPKWINDDYVKFLRYGQYFIEKNGSGLLAFINPHGFLDNPTFRGMRWNLLKTYDKIYTLDLHGNAKKKEIALDGGIDQNVFDIEQGVAITIFVKTGKKKSTELGQVFNYDLYGKREFKYDFLNNNSIETIKYKKLPNISPNYFFVSKDFDEQSNYDLGFSLSDLFILNNVGIVTARDGFTIHKTKSELEKTIQDFLSLDDEEARNKFNLGKDVRDWQVGFAKKDLKTNYPEKGELTKLSYRLFDDRWTFYTGNSKGFHCYPRTDVMQHFLKGKNVGLSLCKQFKTGNNYVHVFISNKIIESSFVSNRTSEITSIFPLYLYPKNSIQQKTDNTKEERKPNLNIAIVKQIADKIGLTFTNEKENDDKTFAPIDVLDYIYAVLHSPTYREKYKEFLKINFPRVPYPKDKNKFWELVKLGSEIRTFHLLENPKSEDYITTYPINGNNIVLKPRYDNGKVWINESQYFEGVSEQAWNFYIGGYQPAQKWLKDRKDNVLNFEDIFHYQKIIVALTETNRLMQEIDTLGI